MLKYFIISICFSLYWVLFTLLMLSTTSSLVRITTAPECGSGRKLVVHTAKQYTATCGFYGSEMGFTAVKCALRQNMALHWWVRWRNETLKWRLSVSCSLLGHREFHISAQCSSSSPRCSGRVSEELVGVSEEKWRCRKASCCRRRSAGCSADRTEDQSSNPTRLWLWKMV